MRQNCTPRRCRCNTILVADDWRSNAVGDVCVLTGEVVVSVRSVLVVDFEYGLEDGELDPGPIRILMVDAGFYEDCFRSDVHDKPARKQVFIPEVIRSGRC